MNGINTLTIHPYNFKLKKGCVALQYLKDFRRTGTWLQRKKHNVHQKHFRNRGTERYLIKTTTLVLNSFSFVTEIRT
jgi:hypothetical protein